MNLYKSGFLVIIFLLMLSLTGCVDNVPVPVLPIPSLPTPQETQTPTLFQTAPTTSPVTGPSLLEKTWYLVAFNSDGSSSTVLAGTVITAVFDQSGQVSGSAGCNRYTASYGGTLNALSIGAPVITKMNCPSAPPGTVSQESFYLTTLRGAARYNINGNLMTLMDHNGKQILTYSDIPPGPGTPLPLEGTVWYLNSFIDAQGHIFKPTSVPVSARFGSDGTLIGNAGCNNYSAKYAIGTGGMITISNIVSPKIPCTDPTVTEQENLYLGSLPSMKIEVISGSELTLSDGSGRATMLYDTTP